MISISVTDDKLSMELIAANTPCCGMMVSYYASIIWNYFLEVSDIYILNQIATVFTSILLVTFV